MNPSQQNNGSHAPRAPREQTMEKFRAGSLRAPMTTTMESISSRVSDMQINGLNPNASDFVPTGGLNPGAHEFIPRAPQPALPPQPVFNESELISPQEEEVLCELGRFITNVTLAPDQFERCVHKLVTTVAHEIQHSKGGLLMQAVVDQIVDHGIRQQNFRYSGARLCQAIAASLPDQTLAANFVGYLIYKCHLMFPELLADNYDAVKARSFALFLGEVYAQFDFGFAAPLGRNLAEFVSNFIKLLHNLIASGNRESMKTGVQVLKLAGAHLEHCELQTLPIQDVNVEMVVALCATQAKTPTIDKTLQFMLNSIPALHAREWDRARDSNSGSAYSGGDSAAAAPANGGTPLNNSDEEVVYGPDGIPLSKEELQFLNSSCLDSASDSLTESDEYDVAYEQFLRETGQ